MKVKTKYIYDFILGECEISKLGQTFIDTPEFQRLRFFRQLGPSFFVYPSANSDRFTHSIGVGYLAKIVGNHLQKLHPDKVTDRIIDLLHVAGLTHDIGHGPFSHAFDVFVENSNSKMKSHEERSKKIIRFIVNKYKIPLKNKEVDFICDCIDPPEELKNNWKYQIISNTVDVDRLDYIPRDSTTTGIPVSINERQIKKLIRFMYIKNDQIYFYNKSVNLIKQLLNARKDLHEIVYQHKTALAIEKMLKDIFDNVKNFEEYNMENIIENIEEFLKIDDSILRTIYYDKRVDIKVKNLITRIYTRDFYNLEYTYKYEKINFNVNFDDNINYKKIFKELCYF